MPNARSLLVTCLAVGAPALLIAGCGEDDAPSAAATAPPAATSTAAAPTEAKPAPAATDTTTSATKADVPEFSGELIDGGTFDNSMVQANTVMFVFASWCPSCRTEAPNFAAFQRAHPDLNYIYVAVEDDPADAKAFMAEHGLAPGEVINDRDRSVAQAFGLTGQPNTVFVPAEGELTKIIGPAGTERLTQAAAQL